jgi:signal transduction histidine kinase
MRRRTPKSYYDRWPVAASSPSAPQNERHANRLRILAESSHAFAEATTEIERLLGLVARRCAELVGDGCYIRLIAPDGITMLPVATYHPDPEIQRYLQETSASIPLRVGEGISGRVMENGEPIFMPELPFEVFKRQTKPEFIPVFERVGITSLIVARLRARGATLGFVALVRNGQGRPAYTTEDLDLVKDLADRAALAIDTSQLLQDLERRVRERTEELEAFSYSVSHDLRAPLRAIDGFSLMLEEEHNQSLDAEGLRLLGVIRRNTQRMGQLIDDLLRFSRLGKHGVSRTKVAMRPIVDNITEELRAGDQTRTLDFRIGDLPPAQCDYELVRQVWANLLGNAVKYTRDRNPAVIEVSGALGTHEIHYAVKDNGAGFDPRYADKLFQVFQRLHGPSEFEGNGVGLALVKRIVAKHGGRVWAEGEPGRGATFGFALPNRSGHE